MMKRKELFSQNSNSSYSGSSNGESVTQPMALDQIQTQTESSAPISPTAKKTKPNHKEFAESPILSADLKSSESIASNNVYESRYRKPMTDFLRVFFEGLRYEACIIKEVEILNKKMIDEKQKYELNRDKLKTLSDLNERAEFEFIKAKSEETAAKEKLEAKRNERGYGPDSLKLESPIEFGESSSPVPDNSALEVCLNCSPEISEQNRISLEYSSIVKKQQNSTECRFYSPKGRVDLDLPTDQMETSSSEEDNVRIKFSFNDPESYRKLIDSTLELSHDFDSLNKLTREQFLKHRALNQSQGIQNTAFLLKTYEDLLKKSSAMEQDNVSLFKEIKEIETSINHFEKGRMKSESKKRAIEEEMTSLNIELKKLAEKEVDSSTLD